MGQLKAGYASVMLVCVAGLRRRIRWAKLPALGRQLE